MKWEEINFFSSLDFDSKKLFLNFQRQTSVPSSFKGKFFGAANVIISLNSLSLSLGKLTQKDKLIGRFAVWEVLIRKKVRYRRREGLRRMITGVQSQRDDYY